MFTYHDLDGAIVAVPTDAKITLADPRPGDGPGARTVVVIDEAGVVRHRPALEPRGQLAAALVASRT